MQPLSPFSDAVGRTGRQRTTARYTVPRRELLRALLLILIATTNPFPKPLHAERQPLDSAGIRGQSETLHREHASIQRLPDPRTAPLGRTIFDDASAGRYRLPSVDPPNRAADASHSSATLSRLTRDEDLLLPPAGSEDLLVPAESDRKYRLPDPAGTSSGDQSKPSNLEAKESDREIVETPDSENSDGGDSDVLDSSSKQSTLADAYSNSPRPQVGHVPYDPSLFIADPDYSDYPYWPDVEADIWDGKTINPVERPWLELGRGLYRRGPLPRSQTFLGDHNLVAQHLLDYGDYRTGVAYVDSGAHDQWVWAHRLNLDFDWKITDTERIHGFTGPIDRGTQFSRLVFDNGEFSFFDEFDRNWDTFYFEGDLGSLLAGWMAHDSTFDLPMAVGLIPLLYQNGIWMEDAFVGAAVTLPARHSAAWHWSNYDLTFFVGFDELNSPAFPGDDSAASVYGTILMLEAYDGYVEAGYALLDDTSGRGLGYHNVGVSYTRRYWHRVSNSMRVIVNSGQAPAAGPRTADGVLFLLENSLISSQPNTVVPYMNLFAGYGRPQSVARAAVSGGVLRNTGILFETDGLTGFAFLDDTANNTYGGALGINWLGADFTHQVIVELGMVQTFGRRGGRRTADDQYGVGMRYQRPLTHAWLVRMDGLYGFFESAGDIAGGRLELRYKF